MRNIKKSTTIIVEKKVAIKIGELFITSILEKNLNNYDNRVEDILFELA